MADIRTTTNTLNLTFAYADEDTRTIKIPDPNNSIDTATLKTAATALGELTLSDRSKGDTTKGAYVSVVGGAKVYKTKIQFDLNQRA